ncbi:MAG: hypothetical protein V8T86_00135 [Victivallis sp.]
MGCLREAVFVCDSHAGAQRRRGQHENEPGIPQFLCVPAGGQEGEHGERGQQHAAPLEKRERLVEQERGRKHDQHKIEPEDRRAHPGAVLCYIASMSSRFEVTDSAPETAPQSSVAPKSLSGLHGRNASSANQTLPAHGDEKVRATAPSWRTA